MKLNKSFRNFLKYEINNLSLNLRHFKMCRNIQAFVCYSLVFYAKVIQAQKAVIL